MGQQTFNLVQKAVNDFKTLDLLLALKQRWADEKEHEDWADYTAQMKKHIPGVLRGTKRPFGYVKNFDGQNVQIYLKLRGNRANLAAKNVK